MESSMEWMHSAASPTCPANKRPLLELPKAGPRLDDGFCKCRPICKNRRRVLKGRLLETSQERLCREKVEPDCIRRWCGSSIPNGQCPLLSVPRHLQQQNARRGTVFRLCQAPMDAEPDTPYLRFLEFVKRIGADAGLRVVCPFCECGGCCNCARGARAREYTPRDPERVGARREEMRAFDARVRELDIDVRAMYDIPNN